MSTTLMMELLVMAVVCFVTGAIACPSQCSCRGKITNCYGLGLKEFPRDIPAMTEVLDLQSNEIEILQKKSLSKLKNLKELKLRFNKLRIIEPGTFRKMPQLRKIDLAANLIQKLPNRIFSGASGLTQLDLSENYLESIDNLFNGLSLLERLDIGNNKIKALTYNSLRDLNQVMFLILSNNNISSIAKRAFKNMKMLSYLVIRNNPFGNIDDVLADNDKLSYVELANCKLTSIPNRMPSSLKYLQLGENNITRVDATDLVRYKFLGILILDENQISYVEEGAFSHMNLLQDLWLNVNKLATIPRALPRGIKSLYLDHNNINKIGVNDIVFGAKLETMSIRDNNLQEINSESFRNPEFLKKLELNGNNFTAIYNSTFSHLTHLESLAMNRNTLNVIDTHAFIGLSSLTTLEMAHIIGPENCVQGNIFKTLHNLKILDLQFSSGIVKRVLSSEDILNSLQSLEELNLKDNDIKTLPPYTSTLMSQVQTVKLDENIFHCDENMIWLKNWINANENKEFFSSDVKCYTPLNVRGRQISSLQDHEFSRNGGSTTVEPHEEYTVSDSRVRHSKYKSTTIISITPSPRSQSTTAGHKKDRHTSPSSTTNGRRQTARKNRTTTTSQKPTLTVSTHKIPIRKEHNYFRTLKRTKYAQVTSTPSITSTLQDKIVSINTNTNTTASYRASNEDNKQRNAPDVEKITTSKIALKNDFPSSKSDTRNVKTESVKSVLTTMTPMTAENSKENDGNSLKVTAITTTISAIVFVFISIAVAYLIYTKRKKLVYHRARKYQDDGDIVFYITDSEGLKTIPSSNKLTREDRGSVTSRPSEDITNDYDPEMKVYTWDDD